MESHEPEIWEKIMSKRAELRRQEKNNVKSGKIYHLTQKQIEEMKREITMEILPEASEKAFKLMMGISASVLAEDYWPKSGKKKIPEFLQKTYSLFESFEAGVVTMDQIEASLWEYGKMKIEL